MPVPKTIAEGRARIASLVRRFQSNLADYTRPGSRYNETAARSEYINPFLESLGWDVANERGETQDLREVVYEPTVEDRDERLSRKPDYEIRLARQRKFFVEAKKPSVNIEVDKGPAFQIRRYGFSAGMPVSLLTNFYQLAIYDCVPPPAEADLPHVARLHVFSLEELEAKFDEIWASFSRDAVYAGAFDEQFRVGIHRQGTSQFDELFLTQVKAWRKRLAEDIHARNPRLASDELTYVIQRIINRLVFLRICEDRDLEKYETLRKLDRSDAYAALNRLVKQADHTYDSGLFSLIDDPSLQLDVGNDCLMSIVEELYFPQSPYTFAVVDPAVLGDIYELFVAQEIVIGGAGEIEVLDKPEVKASGGVATTPAYIVDQIVGRAIGPPLAGKSPSELRDFSVADIACGSGVFLLKTLQRLFDCRLNWCVADGASKHRDKAYEVGQGQWRLKLHEKRRLLLDHVYGVDIDPQAVEVARFSLLVKLLEDETPESIAAYRARFKQPALPPLDENVVCGNSLVAPAQFAAYAPEAAADMLEEVNPLDWEEQFPSVMERGKFAVVVGNPPYIRIQNMMAYSRAEAQFYQDPASGYRCAQSDNFDKYSLFIERALSLLRDDGRLGYIVPHKFFTIKSGESLREIISEGRLLDQVVYFGVHQVFARSSTYTCILVLDRSGQETFNVETVPNLAHWRYGQAGDTAGYPASSISSRPWSFVPDGARLLFDRLRSANRRTLGDVAQIFVGVQTSADGTYIISPTSQTQATVTFADASGREWTIEREILRPSLLDVPLRALSKPDPNTFIIFPYHAVGKRAALYTPEEMANRFPLAWAYLRDNRSELRKRSVQGGTPRTWYRYGRSQSLTKFDSPKLILPILSTEPRCAYDDANLVVTGGGNGPYYLVRPRGSERMSIFYLQAILCHPVIEAMVRSRASVFRGGYYSHGKQFITTIPIADVDFANPEQRRKHDEIVDVVQKLIQNADQRKTARTPKKRQVLDRQRTLLIAKVVELVSAACAITAADMEIAEGVGIPGSTGGEA